MKIFTSKSIVTILFTSASLYVQAQIGIGLKGGLNQTEISNINPDVEPGETLVVGFLPGAMFGGIISYKISPRFAIKTELLYSAQGNRFTFRDDGLSATTTNRFNYLQIPLLLKFNIVNRERSTWFINAGPYAAYLLSAKYIFLDPDKVETRFKINSNEEGWNDLNKFDAGIGGGTGITFKVGPGDIIIEGRMSTGFISLLREVDPNDANKKYLNTIINLSVGYIYNFTKKEN